MQTYFAFFTAAVKVLTGKVCDHESAFGGFFVGVFRMSKSVTVIRDEHPFAIAPLLTTPETKRKRPQSCDCMTVELLLSRGLLGRDSTLQKLLDTWTWITMMN